MKTVDDVRLSITWNPDVDDGVGAWVLVHEGGIGIASRSPLKIAAFVAAALAECARDRNPLEFLALVEAAPTMALVLGQFRADILRVFQAYSFEAPAACGRMMIVDDDPTYRRRADEPEGQDPT